VHLDSNWVGAIGQWAGAIGTVAAVWTALRISAKDGRQREQDRVDEARGRAAMVFTKDDGGSVVVANHSDRPVRDVAVRVGHPSEMLLQWSPSNPTGYVTDLRRGSASPWPPSGRCGDRRGGGVAHGRSTRGVRSRRRVVRSGLWASVATSRTA
jgi:hypothetical protein